MAESVTLKKISIQPFDFVGHQVLTIFRGTFRFIKFLYDKQSALFGTRFRFRETIQQIYVIGFQSAPVILFSLSFAAAVTIIEFAYHMNLVLHSTSLVPGFSALLILRELGAVNTSLLLTSRVGAGIAAELGTMTITEQVDALKLLSVDPFNYLVVPRLVASILSTMTLVVFADGVCIFFSIVMSANYLGYSPHSFISSMNHFAEYKDF